MRGHVRVGNWITPVAALRGEAAAGIFPGGGKICRNEELKDSYVLATVPKARVYFFSQEKMRAFGKAAKKIHNRSK